MSTSVPNTPIKSALMPYTTKTNLAQGSFIDRDTLIHYKIYNYAKSKSTVQGMHNQKMPWAPRQSALC